MIVYREVWREVAARAELTRLAGLIGSAGVVDLLVELGAWEQGVIDALAPHWDVWTPLVARIRSALLTVGEAYRAEAIGMDPGPRLRRAAAALDALGRGDLPDRIRVRPPEGYVHYALNPWGYLRAAEDYRAGVGDRRAARAIVVGVRSIGTSLSAVVAAGVGSRRSVTVRPRGGFGERHVVADPGLTGRLAAWLTEGGDVIVVDEGPGVTGETFAAVAAWPRGLGLADDRVVLFPSRGRGLEIAPADRREWFAAARKCLPAWDDPRPGRIAARLGGPPDLIDLSGGRWRTEIPGAAGLPAAPIHERRKLLGCLPSGGRCLIRYVGLGSWGAEATTRAEALADAGVGPRVLDRAGGFLALDWIEGRPADRSAGWDPSFLAALAAYLTARARRFRTGARAEPAPLISMLLENAAEARGTTSGLDAAIRRIERLPPRPAHVSDARLQPHEWIRTTNGYVKIDALDHGDGLRLPGPVDLAWDLAGAWTEFDLADRVLTRLVGGCAAAAGDPPADLNAAVRAYRPPYVALAWAECTLAAREAPTDAERAALEAAAARYRSILARDLGAGEAAGSPLDPVKARK